VLFDAGNFEQADFWFSVFGTKFSDSVRYTDKANKLASWPNSKSAENLIGKGQAGDAANVLQTVAKNTRDAQLRDRALFESATQLQKLNRYKEALWRSRNLPAATANLNWRMRRYTEQRPA